MKYAYYPGCSMASTGIPYSLSTKFVTEKIGMELIEIPDWNCCGASAAHSVDENLALALPARTLALHEKLGSGLDIAVPCAACYSRLKTTVHEVRKSKTIAEKIEKIIEMPYHAESDILSFLEVFSRPETMEAVKDKILRPFDGLKVACYYGCLTIRPVEVAQPDDAESPMQMDKILALCGIEPVDWAFKTECCGAGLQVSAPNDARPLLHRIFKNAKANGAQAIAVACPLCMLNLDMREAEINKKYNEEFDMPVYFFTELLAASLGADEKISGIDKHFFPAAKLIKESLTKGDDKK